MSNDRIAVLGAGRLGETLIRGLIAAGTVDPHDVIVTAAHDARVQDLEKRIGVRGAASNLEAVREARLVLLTVKPHQVDPVVREIAPGLTPQHLLVSGAASASTAYIESRIGADVPVVRAMPNTPAMLRLGMTALCAGRHAKDEHVTRA